MIIIKTQKEISIMKKAGAICASVKQILKRKIKPGMSTLEIDEIAIEEIKKRNGGLAFKGMYGFPNCCCISVNEELIHGIPKADKILKSGDIVSIDFGAIVDGFYSDNAFTIGVGKIKQEDQDLIKVAEGAFNAGFKAIKPGAKVGDISYAIGKFVRSKKMYVPKEYSGHGIGRDLHEDPQIFNDGNPRAGALLKDGMVICVEPMILQGSDESYTDLDEWTVVSSTGKNSAHHEQMILIENGYGVILTDKGV